MVESEANKVDPMEVKCCGGEWDGTNGVIVESTHRGRMKKMVFRSAVWCYSGKTDTRRDWTDLERSEVDRGNRVIADSRRLSRGDQSES